MAYLFNSLNFDTLDIVAAHAGGGNIALQGWFDFPSRIGDVSHEWGDENGLEIYTASGDLFWGGRDIIFEGHISGSRTTIYSALKSLYGAASGATGLSVFSTPYGDFNVYVRKVQPTHSIDISKIKIEFREPVVSLTGGTIPGASASSYQIDGIPMSSFGLYAGDYKGVIDLPEMQQQLFTKIEAEGFSISKRKAGVVDFSGVLIAANLVTFIANIKNLYALFSSAGTRTFSLNGQVVITGVPVNGFRVENVMIAGEVIAGFRTEITAITIV